MENLNDKNELVQTNETAPQSTSYTQTLMTACTDAAEIGKHIANKLYTSTKETVKDVVKVAQDYSTHKELNRSNRAHSTSVDLGIPSPPQLYFIDPFSNDVPLPVPALCPAQMLAPSCRHGGFLDHQHPTYSPPPPQPVYWPPMFNMPPAFPPLPPQLYQNTLFDPYFFDYLSGLNSQFRAPDSTEKAKKRKKRKHPKKKKRKRRIKTEESLEDNEPYSWSHPAVRKSKWWNVWNKLDESQGQPLKNMRPLFDQRPYYDTATVYHAVGNYGDSPNYEQVKPTVAHMRQLNKRKKSQTEPQTFLNTLYDKKLSTSAVEGDDLDSEGPYTRRRSADVIYADNAAGPDLDDWYGRRKSAATSVSDDNVKPPVTRAHSPEENVTRLSATLFRSLQVNVKSRKGNSLKVKRFNMDTQSAQLLGSFFSCEARAKKVRRRDDCTRQPYGISTEYRQMSNSLCGCRCADDYDAATCFPSNPGRHLKRIMSHFYSDLMNLPERKEKESSSDRQHCLVNSNKSNTMLSSPCFDSSEQGSPACTSDFKSQCRMDKKSGADFRKENVKTSAEVAKDEKCDDLTFPCPDTNTCRMGVLELSTKPNTKGLSPCRNCYREEDSEGSEETCSEDDVTASSRSSNQSHDDTDNRLRKKLATRMKSPKTQQSPSAVSISQTFCVASTRDCQVKISQNISAKRRSSQGGTERLPLFYSVRGSADRQKCRQLVCTFDGSATECESEADEKTSYKCLYVRSRPRPAKSRERVRKCSGRYCLCHPQSSLAVCDLRHGSDAEYCGRRRSQDLFYLSDSSEEKRGASEGRKFKLYSAVSPSRNRRHFDTFDGMHSMDDCRVMPKCSLRTDECCRVPKCSLKTNECCYTPNYSQELKERCCVPKCSLKNNECCCVPKCSIETNECCCVPKCSLKGHECCYTPKCSLETNECCCEPKSSLKGHECCYTPKCSLETNECCYVPQSSFVTNGCRQTPLCSQPTNDCRQTPLCSQLPNDCRQTPQCSQLPNGCRRTPICSQLPNDCCRTPLCSQLPNDCRRTPLCSQQPNDCCQTPLCSQLPNDCRQTPLCSQPTNDCPRTPLCSQQPNDCRQMPLYSQLPNDCRQTPLCPQLPCNCCQTPICSQLPNDCCQTPLCSQPTNDCCQMSVCSQKSNDCRQTPICSQLPNDCCQTPLCSQPTNDSRQMSVCSQKSNDCRQTQLCSQLPNNFRKPPVYSQPPNDIRQATTCSQPTNDIRQATTCSQPTNDCRQMFVCSKKSNDRQHVLDCPEPIKDCRRITKYSKEANSCFGSLDEAKFVDPPPNSCPSLRKERANDCSPLQRQEGQTSEYGKLSRCSEEINDCPCLPDYKKSFNDCSPPGKHSQQPRSIPNGCPTFKQTKEFTKASEKCQANSTLDAGARNVVCHDAKVSDMSEPCDESNVRPRPCTTQRSNKNVTYADKETTCHLKEKTGKTKRGFKNGKKMDSGYLDSDSGDGATVCARNQCNYLKDSNREYTADELVPCNDKQLTKESGRTNVENCPIENKDSDTLARRKKSNSRKPRKDLPCDEITVCELRPPSHSNDCICDFEESICRVKVDDTESPGVGRRTFCLGQDDIVKSKGRSRRRETEDSKCKETAESQRGKSKSKALSEKSKSGKSDDGKKRVNQQSTPSRRSKEAKKSSSSSQSNTVIEPSPSISSDKVPDASSISESDKSITPSFISSNDKLVDSSFSSSQSVQSTTPSSSSGQLNESGNDVKEKDIIDHDQSKNGANSNDPIQANPDESFSQFSCRSNNSSETADAKHLVMDPIVSTQDGDNAAKYHHIETSQRKYGFFKHFLPNQNVGSNVISNKGNKYKFMFKKFHHRKSKWPKCRSLDTHEEDVLPCIAETKGSPLSYQIEQTHSVLAFNRVCQESNDERCYETPRGSAQAVKTTSDWGNPPGSNTAGKKETQNPTDKAGAEKNKTVHSSNVNKKTLAAKTKHNFTDHVKNVLPEAISSTSIVYSSNYQRLLQYWELICQQCEGNRLNLKNTSDLNESKVETLSKCCSCQEKIKFTKAQSKPKSSKKFSAVLATNDTMCVFDFNKQMGPDSSHFCSANQPTPEAKCPLSYENSVPGMMLNHVARKPKSRNRRDVHQEEISSFRIQEPQKCMRGFRISSGLDSDDQSLELSRADRSQQRRLGSHRADKKHTYSSLSSSGIQKRHTGAEIKQTNLDCNLDDCDQLYSCNGREDKTRKNASHSCADNRQIQPNNSFNDNKEVDIVYLDSDSREDTKKLYSTFSREDKKWKNSGHSRTDVRHIHHKHSRKDNKQVDGYLDSESAEDNNKIYSSHGRTDERQIQINHSQRKQLGHSSTDCMNSHSSQIREDSKRKHSRHGLKAHKQAQSNHHLTDHKQANPNNILADCKQIHLDHSGVGSRTAYSRHSLSDSQKSCSNHSREDIKLKHSNHERADSKHAHRHGILLEESMHNYSNQSLVDSRTTRSVRSRVDSRKAHTCRNREDSRKTRASCSREESVKVRTIGIREYSINARTSRSREYRRKTRISRSREDSRKTRTSCSREDSGKTRTSRSREDSITVRTSRSREDRSKTHTSRSREDMRQIPTSSSQEESRKTQTSQSREDSRKRRTSRSREDSRNIPTSCSPKDSRETRTSCSPKDSRDTRTSCSREVSKHKQSTSQCRENRKIKKHHTNQCVRPCFGCTNVKSAITAFPCKFCANTKPGQASSSRANVHLESPTPPCFKRSKGKAENTTSPCQSGSDVVNEVRASGIDNGAMSPCYCCVKQSSSSESRGSPAPGLSCTNVKPIRKNSPCFTCVKRQNETHVSPCHSRCHINGTEDEFPHRSYATTKREERRSASHRCDRSDQAEQHSTRVRKHESTGSPANSPTLLNQDTCFTPNSSADLRCAQSTRNTLKQKTSGTEVDLKPAIPCVCCASPPGEMQSGSSISDKLSTGTGPSSTTKSSQRFSCKSPSDQVPLSKSALRENQASLTRYIALFASSKESCMSLLGSSRGKLKNQSPQQRSRNKGEHSSGNDLDGQVSPKSLFRNNFRNTVNDSKVNSSPLYCNSKPKVEDSFHLQMPTEIRTNILSENGGKEVFRENEIETFISDPSSCDLVNKPTDDKFKNQSMFSQIWFNLLNVERNAVYDLDCPLSSESKATCVSSISTLPLSQAPDGQRASAPKASCHAIYKQAHPCDTNIKITSCDEWVSEKTKEPSISERSPENVSRTKSSSKNNSDELEVISLEDDWNHYYSVSGKSEECQSHNCSIPPSSPLEEMFTHADKNTPKVDGRKPSPSLHSRQGSSIVTSPQRLGCTRPCLLQRDTEVARDSWKMSAQCTSSQGRADCFAADVRKCSVHKTSLGKNAFECLSQSVKNRHTFNPMLRKATRQCSQLNGTLFVGSPTRKSMFDCKTKRSMYFSDCGAEFRTLSSPTRAPLRRHVTLTNGTKAFKSSTINSVFNFNTRDQGASNARYQFVRSNLDPFRYDATSSRQVNVISAEIRSKILSPPRYHQISWRAPLHCTRTSQISDEAIVKYLDSCTAEEFWRYLYKVKHNHSSDNQTTKTSKSSQTYFNNTTKMPESGRDTLTHDSEQPIIFPQHGQTLNTRTLPHNSNELNNIEYVSSVQPIDCLEQIQKDEGNRQRNNLLKCEVCRLEKSVSLIKEEKSKALSPVCMCRKHLATQRDVVRCQNEARCCCRNHPHSPKYPTHISININTDSPERTHCSRPASAAQTLAEPFYCNNGNKKKSCRGLRGQSSSETSSCDSSLETTRDMIIKYALANKLLKKYPEEKARKHRSKKEKNRENILGKISEKMCNFSSETYQSLSSSEHLRFTAKYSPVCNIKTDLAKKDSNQMKNGAGLKGRKFYEDVKSDVSKSDSRVLHYSSPTHAWVHKVDSSEDSSAANAEENRCLQGFNGQGKIEHIDRLLDLDIRELLRDEQVQRGLLTPQAADRQNHASKPPKFQQGAPEMPSPSKARASQRPKKTMKTLNLCSGGTSQHSNTATFDPHSNTTSCSSSRRIQYSQISNKNSKDDAKKQNITDVSATLQDARTKRPSIPTSGLNTQGYRSGTSLDIWDSGNRDTQNFEWKIHQNVIGPESHVNEKNQHGVNKDGGRIHTFPRPYSVTQGTASPAQQKTSHEGHIQRRHKLAFVLTSPPASTPAVTPLSHLASTPVSLSRFSVTQTPEVHF